MQALHSLLLRQIKRHFGSHDKIPPELADFIHSVNTAYHEYETDREMLERSLELSSQEMLQTNAEMRAVFSALPDMLFVIDSSGAILDHKVQSREDVFPVKERRLIGSRIQDIPLKEVSEKFQRALNAVRESQSPISIEYELPIQGIPQFYEARFASVIEDLYIVIVRNITERKLSEAALRKERDFVNKLVQTSPAFFIALNGDRRIIMINDAMLTAIGYQSEEVIGKDLLQFIPVHQRGNVSESINTLLIEMQPLAYESSILTINGNELNVEFHGRPVLKESGELDFFFAVGIDVTGKKKLESQLEQSRKMEAIGTLAGGVAHDFNNLLMGIQGRISLMLLDTSPVHSHHEHLMAVQECIKSAATLTAQLLGFARAGKYEVKPTDINSLISKNLSIYARTKKEVRIHTDFQDNVWAIEADQNQIEQVFVNLYINAFQAMPGGGDLLIKTRNTSLKNDFAKANGVKPGDYVVISISDSGIGMAKDIQQRIFDPFFTTKDRGRGTGLGLASAYGIIKNHNGTINVQSEIGIGTTFTIYFPASLKRVDEKKLQPPDIKKGSETVLIVDDEPMILEVGKSLLEHLGYAVMTASGGKQASDIVTHSPNEIDLVILDMIMPEMGGSDAFDLMKKIAPDIKILLASGYSLDGQATKIMNRGCNGFIQKPFDLANLSLKVRQILDSPDSQPSA